MFLKARFSRYRSYTLRYPHACRILKNGFGGKEMFVFLFMVQITNKANFSFYTLAWKDEIKSHGLNKHILKSFIKFFFHAKWGSFTAFAFPSSAKELMCWEMRSGGGGRFPAQWESTVPGISGLNMKLAYLNGWVYVHIGVRGTEP